MHLFTGHKARLRLPVWPATAWAALLLLAACGGGSGDATPPSAAPPTLGKALGTVEVDITGLGTAQPASAMRWDGAAPQKQAQGLLRTSAVASPSATVAATTNLPAGLDIEFQSASSIDTGGRPGGTRYISVTYRVRNAAFSGTPGTGTPYDAARNNLTFLAVIPSTGINTTAITRFVKFDNSAADPALALQLVPTHGMNSTATAVEAGRASMQVYRETELPTADASVTDVLPYGFVVNNVNDGSRTLPASPAAGQFDGLVTFAFKLPLQANANDDPFKISLRFQVMEDSNTRVTQSLEDTGPAATARAAALGSSDLAVLCGQVAAVQVANPICRVRLAGPAASPTAYLSTATPLAAPRVVASPGNLGGLATTAEIALTTSQDMAAPPAGSLVVNGSMSGRRVLPAGAYSGVLDGGAGSGRPNQLVFRLGATDKPFFRGETVSYTATSANTSSAGDPLQAFVGSHRVQGAAAGSSGLWPGRGLEALGTTPRGMAVGDLNGDGRPDLVVSSSGLVAQVLLADGAGGFLSSPVPVVSTGSSVAAVALGDLNGDGQLDLVVATGAGNSVAVLLGNGAGGFGSPVITAVGNLANAVALGDLNGDGRLDVVALNQGATTVSVLLGDGTGGLAPAVDTASGTGPQAIAVGDFNGDGRADVAVVNSSGVRVLLRNAIGGFATAVSYAMGTGPRAIALADLNGDGRLDMVTANATIGSASVRLGAANGTFGANANFTTGAGAQSVALGDVTGDGLRDVVVLNTNANANTVSVLPGNGAGGFGTAVNLPVAASVLVSVALGDFNVDGKLDAVVASGGGTTVAHLSVLLGNGNGSSPLATAASLATGTGPQAVALGDLNGDGVLDMVVVNGTANTVSVRLGTAAGAFGAATNTAVGTAPRALVLADFNQDGRLDVVTADLGADTVSLLLGDGAGGLAAALPITVGPAPQALAVADVNGDGRLDLLVANTFGDSVSVLLGDGAGGFNAAADLATPVGPIALVVGDFNADSRLDLAVLCNTDQAVAIRLGNGAGGFATGQDVAVAPKSTALAVGDLNGDGRLDLAVVSDGPAGANLRLLLGNGAGGMVLAGTHGSGDLFSAVALADVNGDGRLDVITLDNSFNHRMRVWPGTGAGGLGTPALYALRASPRGLALGDLNGDGKLDAVVVGFTNNVATVLLAP